VTPATTTTKLIAATQTITTASTNNAYSASGLPTTGMVSIHLFPCTASGAPTTSSGTTTFTAPGGDIGDQASGYRRCSLRSTAPRMGQLVTAVGP